MTRLVPLMVFGLSVASAAQPIKVLAYGSSGSDCSLPTPLAIRPPPGLEISTGALGHGVVRSGPRALLAVNALSDPRPSYSVLDAGRPESTPIDVLVTPRAFTFVAPGPFTVDLLAASQKAATDIDIYSASQRIQGTLRRHQTDGGEVLELEADVLDVGGTEIDAVLTSLVRFGSEQTTMYTVCRTHGEWSRQQALLKKARVSADVLVSVGDVVGSSNWTERAKADRLRQLEALGHHAFVPGRAELELGKEGLARLATTLPLTAANLVADAEVPVLPRFRLVSVGEFKVAIIGLVGDRALGSAGPATGLHLMPMGVAVSAALDSVHTALGRQADAVIIATDLHELSDQRNLRLLSQARADLVLGYFGQTPASSIDVKRGQGAQSRRPLLTLATTERGPTHLTLHIDAARRWVERIEAEITPAETDTPPDLEVQRDLFEDDFEQAAQQSDVVLPTADEVMHGSPELLELSRSELIGRRDHLVPHALWNGAIFRRLLAGLARRAVDAEVGVSRALPVHTTIGGSVTASVLASAISAHDRVRAITLTGAELVMLSRHRLDNQLLIFSGYDAASAMVGGRPVLPTQRYRVALPDALWSDQTLEAVLEPKRFVEGPAYATLLVDGLRAVRDEHGGLTHVYIETLRELLTAKTKLEPLWTFGIEQLNVTYQFNFVANNQGYTAIQDQRIQSPTAYLLTAKGKFWVARDSELFTTKASLFAAFNRRFLRDLDLTRPLAERELEDIIRTELEARVKALRINTSTQGVSDFIPYLKAAFDTEVTPGETGTIAMGNVQRLPHRAFLEGSAGVGLFPGTSVKEVRLGFIARGNLTKPAGRKLQLGLESALNFTKSLPFNLIWAGDLGVSYYPPAGEMEGVDDDVLGLRLVARTSLQFPLFTWLTAGISLDYLGFRGKTSTTSMLGHNLQVGLSLIVDRTWKPRFEGP